MIIMIIGIIPENVENLFFLQFCKILWFSLTIMDLPLLAKPKYFQGQA